uniref:Uncharacterized protein n=1 Tax=Romanomermis culicivorax TaxID=13658 RepID=A0A915K2X1_ROMCU
MARFVNDRRIDIKNVNVIDRLEKIVVNLKGFPGSAGAVPPLAIVRCKCEKTVPKTIFLGDIHFGCEAPDAERKNDEI